MASPPPGTAAATDAATGGRGTTVPGVDEHGVLVLGDDAATAPDATGGAPLVLDVSLDGSRVWSFRPDRDAVEPGRPDPTLPGGRPPGPVAGHPRGAAGRPCADRGQRARLRSRAPRQRAPLRDVGPAHRRGRRRGPPPRHRQVRRPRADLRRPLHRAGRPAARRGRGGAPRALRGRARALPLLRHAPGGRAGRSTHRSRRRRRPGLRQPALRPGRRHPGVLPRPAAPQRRGATARVATAAWPSRSRWPSPTTSAAASTSSVAS